MGIEVNFMPNKEVMDKLQEVYPDFKPHYIEAIKALFKLANDLEKVMEHHYQKRFNFSRARYLVMMVLLHCQEKRLQPKDIAKSLNVTPGNMTSLIDALLRDELVEKKSDEKDRRQVWIALTPKGKQFLKKMFPENFKRLAKFMSVISKEEVYQLIHIAGKLQGSLAAFKDE
ncbi:MAG: MarR family transcriptional regulator [Bdellovibrionales bacterium]|nr:MarR family transcriptional regulator [Bdellovibrionales bacterium]